MELPPECPTWAVPLFVDEASPDATSESSDEFAVVTRVSARATAGSSASAPAKTIPSSLRRLIAVTLRPFCGSRAYLKH